MKEFAIATGISFVLILVFVAICYFFVEPDSPALIRMGIQPFAVW